MHSVQISFFASLVLLTPCVFADDCTFPGKTETWHDSVLHLFEIDGRDCKVVCPEKAAEGKPWIWRARFWGHEPQADVALVGKGFHVVYMDVGGLFGNTEAVAHWDSFYDYLTVDHGFAKKAALEGMSRGGLIIYNWAIKNPSKVSAIYADAPVLDIRSWPGGKGRGAGSGNDWRYCLEAYGMTEAQALADMNGPLNKLKILADADVPLLHVVGARDLVVPLPENTDILERRYREMGGKIEVISKPNGGHHPHSLKDPKPIVDFILVSSGIEVSP